MNRARSRRGGTSKPGNGWAWKMRGLLRYSQPADCSCHAGVCNQVEILPGGFDAVLEPDREIPGDLPETTARRLPARSAALSL